MQQSARPGALRGGHRFYASCHRHCRQSRCFDHIDVLLHYLLYHSARGSLWRLHRCEYPASLAALEEATNTQPLVYYEVNETFTRNLGERTGSPLR